MTTRIDAPVWPGKGRLVKEAGRLAREGAGMLDAAYYGSGSRTAVLDGLDKLKAAVAAVERAYGLGVEVD